MVRYHALQKIVSHGGCHCRHRKKKRKFKCGGTRHACGLSAAIVDIERDVPGKTAERICAAPIQTACGSVISSMCIVRGRVKTASTIHMMMPPMSSAIAMTQRL